MQVIKGFTAFSVFAVLLSGSYTACIAQSKASVNGNDSLERVWNHQRSAVKRAPGPAEAATPVKPAFDSVKPASDSVKTASDSVKTASPFYSGKSNATKQGSAVGLTAVLRGDTSALKVITAEAKDSWGKISGETKAAASTLAAEVKEAWDYDKKKLNIGNSRSPAATPVSK